jgi:hypothetical protein
VLILYSGLSIYNFFSSSGFQIEIVIDTFEFVILSAFANLGAPATSGELYL